MARQLDVVRAIGVTAGEEAARMVRTWKATKIVRESVDERDAALRAFCLFDAELREKRNTLMTTSGRKITSVIVENQSENDEIIFAAFKKAVSWSLRCDSDVRAQEVARAYAGDNFFLYCAPVARRVAVANV